MGAKFYDAKTLITVLGVLLLVPAFTLLAPAYSSSFCEYCPSGLGIPCDCCEIGCNYAPTVDGLSINRCAANSTTDIIIEIEVTDRNEEDPVRIDVYAKDYSSPLLPCTEIFNDPSTTKYSYTCTFQAEAAGCVDGQPCPIIVNVTELCACDEQDSQTITFLYDDTPPIISAVETGPNPFYPPPGVAVCGNGRFLADTWIEYTLSDFPADHNPYCDCPCCDCPGCDCESNELRVWVEVLYEADSAHRRWLTNNLKQGACLEYGGSSPETGTRYNMYWDGRNDDGDISIIKDCETYYTFKITAFDEAGNRHVVEQGHTPETKLFNGYCGQMDCTSKVDPKEEAVYKDYLCTSPACCGKDPDCWCQIGSDWDECFCRDLKTTFMEDDPDAEGGAWGTCVPYSGGPCTKDTDCDSSTLACDPQSGMCYLKHFVWITPNRIAVEMGQEGILQVTVKEPMNRPGTFQLAIDPSTDVKYFAKFFGESEQTEVSFEAGETKQIPVYFTAASGGNFELNIIVTDVSNKFIRSETNLEDGEHGAASITVTTIEAETERSGIGAFISAPGLSAWQILLVALVVGISFAAARMQLNKKRQKSGKKRK